MKRRSILCLGAILAAVAIQSSPVHAAGGQAAACQLIGTVDLTSTDLFDASKGNGNFSAGALTCLGSVSGTALGFSADSFSFCAFGTFDTSANPACKSAAQHQDPNYQTYADFNDNTNQGLIAYFQGGATTAAFTGVGGVCVFRFHGAALTAQALISIDSFKCGPDVLGQTIDMTGNATASTIPLAVESGAKQTIPGVSDPYFSQVVFMGTINLAG